MQSGAPEPEVKALAASVPLPGDQFFFSARSAGARTLERLISETAPTELPVLIVGESGTGKEVVALRIHRLSRRRDEPFFKVICSSLNPDCFGRLLHDHDADGQVRDAWARGTLFLDEISELDPACQPKLLHILPDGDAVPNEHCLRTRVISASSRDLEEEIRSGRLRRELFFRLNGVRLTVPPLRQQREDIPGLVDFFLRKHAAQFGRAQPELSRGAMDVLAGYSWPGNIRELENVVRRIVALGDERLALADLTTSIAPWQRQVADGGRLSLREAARAASRQAERELILAALARTRWNRKRAARELQISYKALLYKLKQIGLDDCIDGSDPRGTCG